MTIKVNIRNFGMVAAAYQAACCIELPQILSKHIKGIRFGTELWTDSKIRAFAFCCVVSMMLMRVMQWMTEQKGYKMSTTVLKDELTDIQEVIMVYSSTDAERKITERSAVQKKLWKIFELGKIENQLSLHK